MATVGKGDLVQRVAQETGMSKSDITKALDSILSQVDSAVRGGDRVILRGFGTFDLRERAARKGRNPQTGQEIDIPASRSMGFKAASKS